MLLQYVNLALRFLVEVSILFLIGHWGWGVSEPFIARLLFGVILPITLMLFWGLFVAPKAPYLVAPYIKVSIEIITIGIGVLAMSYTNYHDYTVLYAMIAYINLLFIYIWK